MQIQRTLPVQYECCYSSQFFATSFPFQLAEAAIQDVVCHQLIFKIVNDRPFKSNFDFLQKNQTQFRTVSSNMLVVSQLFIRVHFLLHPFFRSSQKRQPRTFSCSRLWREDFLFFAKEHFQPINKKAQYVCQCVLLSNSGGIQGYYQILSQN